MEELKESVHATHVELAKLFGMKSAGVRPENPGKINSLRKNIARHLTIMNEKSRKASLEVVGK